MDDLELNVPPAPTEVAELADACVQYVRRAVGIELDFTSDTLPILDHYLTQAGATKDEVEELVLSAAGAYLGEVLRRSLGGLRWHVEPGDPSGWRLEGERVFVFFNPIGMAKEALAQAEQPGWFAHLETLPRDRSLLDQSLERMGVIREDDYYRLTVRFEVVEQVLEALDAAALSRQAHGSALSAEAFSPAVYAATARALRGDAPAADES